MSETKTKSPETIFDMYEVTKDLYYKMYDIPLNEAREKIREICNNLHAIHSKEGITIATQTEPNPIDYREAKRLAEEKANRKETGDTLKSRNGKFPYFLWKYIKSFLFGTGERPFLPEHLRRNYDKHFIIYRPVNYYFMDYNGDCRSHRPNAPRKYEIVRYYFCWEQNYLRRDVFKYFRYYIDTEDLKKNNHGVYEKFGKYIDFMDNNLGIENAHQKDFKVWKNCLDIPKVNGETLPSFWLLKSTHKPTNQSQVWSGYRFDYSDDTKKYHSTVKISPQRKTLFPHETYKRNKKWGEKGTTIYLETSAHWRRGFHLDGARTVDIRQSSAIKDFINKIHTEDHNDRYENGNDTFFCNIRAYLHSSHYLQPNASQIHWENEYVKPSQIYTELFRRNQKDRPDSYGPDKMKKCWMPQNVGKSHSLRFVA